MSESKTKPTAFFMPIYILFLSVYLEEHHTRCLKYENVYKTLDA